MVTEPFKVGDPVHYSIFTYATEDRPSDGHGHTDYFYGRVLKLLPGVGGYHYDMLSVECVNGETHNIWAPDAQKVSLLEVLAGAVECEPFFNEGRASKSMTTLALTLACVERSLTTHLPTRTPSDPTSFDSTTEP
jgi:hypothetical protein